MYLQHYSLSQQLLNFTLASFTLIFIYFKFTPMFAKVYQMAPLFSQKHVEDGNEGKKAKNLMKK